MLDAADTYLEAVDGDRTADGDSDCGFLVFRMFNGRSGGPMSVLTDVVVAFPDEGFVSDGLVIGLLLSLSRDAFLRGVVAVSVLPLSGAVLCLVDSIFIFEGLSMASGILFAGKLVGEATDRRLRDGRRSFDTGCDRNSFPFV